MKTENTKIKKGISYPLLLLLACGLPAAIPQAALAVTGSIDNAPKMVQEIPKNQAKVCRDVTCSNPPPTIIDFNKQEKGYPLVIDSILGISGRVWGGDLGWITFNPPFGGVRFADLATGRLTGTAWSQTSGVINFDVTGQQVVIDPKTGQWRGWAWASGPYGGWIKFDCGDPDACVRSTWRGGAAYSSGSIGSVDTSTPTSSTGGIATNSGTAQNNIPGPVSAENTAGNAVQAPAANSSQKAAPAQGTAPVQNTANLPSSSTNASAPAAGSQANAAGQSQAQSQSQVQAQQKNPVPTFPSPEEAKQLAKSPFPVSDALNGFLAGAQNVAGGAGSGLNNAVAGVSSGAESFGSDFSAGAIYLWDNLGGYLEGCVESFDRTVGGAVSFMSSGVSTLADDISQGANGTASAISGAISRLGNGIANGIYSGADGTASAINGAASGLGQGISKGASGVAGAMSGAASGFDKGVYAGAGSLVGIAGDLGDGISQTASVYWSGISGSTGQIGGAITAFWRDLFHGYLEYVRIGDMFWQDVSNGSSRLANLSSEAVNSASAYASDILSNL